MKTIAVFTDFSERSAQAAMYAMRLAQKIKADVLLYNVFLVPAPIANRTQFAWPDEDYDDIKNDTENRLIEMAAKLQHGLIERSFPGAFMPFIGYHCEEHGAAHPVGELEDVVLFVMATPGDEDETAFTIANNCRRLIDSSAIPVLMVPENASLKNVEKFAFATDFSCGDIACINSVANLAKKSSAEIMVINLKPDGGPLTGEQESAFKLFKSAITNDVDYGRVYYRNIPDTYIKRKLDWFVANIRFDMFVTVHRSGNLSDFLFQSGLSKKIGNETGLPLLVYTQTASATPLF